MSTPFPTQLEPLSISSAAAMIEEPSPLMLKQEASM